MKCKSPGDELPDIFSRRRLRARPKALFSGQFGRIRNVVAGPAGGLWITTSKRDGRGVPGPDDDRIVALSLSR